MRTETASKQLEKQSLGTEVNSFLRRCNLDAENDNATFPVAIDTLIK